MEDITLGEQHKLHSIFVINLILELWQFKILLSKVGWTDQPYTKVVFCSTFSINGSFSQQSFHPHTKAYFVYLQHLHYLKKTLMPYLTLSGAWARQSWYSFNQPKQLRFRHHTKIIGLVMNAIGCVHFNRPITATQPAQKSNLDSPKRGYWTTTRLTVHLKGPRLARTSKQSCTWNNRGTRRSFGTTAIRAKQRTVMDMKHAVHTDDYHIWGTPSSRRRPGGAP